MYLEGEGLVVTPTAARMRYSLTLSGQIRVADRDLPGVRHELPAGDVPGTHVRTVLRGAESRSRRTQRRADLPATAVVRRVVASDARSAATTTERCRLCCARWGCSATSTSRRTTCVRARSSGGPSWLASSTRTALSAAPASVQFTSTRAMLAQDFYELVVGLGYRANVMSKRVHGRTEASSIAYTVNFTCADDVFRLSRKMLRHKERSRSSVRATELAIHRGRAARRQSVPVRCIEVDNMAHLYLAGRVHDPHAQLDPGSGHRPASASIRHNIARALLAGSAAPRSPCASSRPRPRSGSGTCARARCARRTRPGWRRRWRRVRGPAVHRRLAEHVADRDPSQCRRLKQRHNLGSSSSTTCS